MQLVEAQPGPEFPACHRFYIRSKTKQTPTGQNYIPGIFRSKSPKLPECTNPNQDLSGLLSLAKPVLRKSLDKNCQVRM